MSKTFKTYGEAYALYSDIVSGRDPDRKNPSIVMDPNWNFIVCWEPKK